MSEEGYFPARFFDGKSAAALSVAVRFATFNLENKLEDNIVLWSLGGINLLTQNDSELRLSHSDHPDCVLIVSREHISIIEANLSEIVSGKKVRRGMYHLVARLVVGAAAVTALLFLGVPMASGPLARATPKSFEIQMGENMTAQYTAILRHCPGNDEGVKAISPLLAEMAEAGEVGFPVTFHFIQFSMPNAFALPGGQVLVTSGLLEVLEDDPEAFVAVVAHELGHVRARDGMQALYRNIGLSFLLEAITGGTGVAQQAILLGGQLSQLKHSRVQEARADETAHEIMETLQLNPEALARAFEAMLSLDGEGQEAAEEAVNKDGSLFSLEIPHWLSSHPDTDVRIKRAQELAVPSARELFTAEEWKVIKSACVSVGEEVTEPAEQTSDQ